MGPFEVAVVAIVCGIIYKLANTYLEHKGAIVAEQELSKMRQEMDEMKQRLVTLEQIVTDESYQLKSKIDSL
ncbi:MULTISPECIES: hypothetical protein [Shewanella]|jgi:uncharacterized membrane protein (DUF106 family)|uniref:Phage shock protein B n=1 Tax=Shewanella fodinae TaxID=552357 RepID=A0A4R2FFI8_9GAMM|nr:MULTISPECIES: hypothetical protein [Shewanella]MDN5369775.1 hypothetical protein [Shewanella sp.]MBO1270921.1 hypothetical protein [Shewanella sp. 4t3-1-2LB]MCL2906991.1 hypothetical protein [Shewanella fodinae]TCN88955.1 hypothetical protein EDC91_103136 [Shewanella fodinae]GGZ05996.1 hypothetical protein GCM10007169_23440 [Shewanella fodinae]